MTQLEREAGREVTAGTNGGAARSRQLAVMAFLLTGLALGMATMAISLHAQATAAPSQDPHYKKVSCEQSGRVGSAEYTDDIGNLHQLWYENFGFRTGKPDDPGGWYEMGESPASSELPRQHRVNGSFDDGEHSLNGTPHSSQEDLDHAHAFNMMRGLLNICLNTEG